MKCCIQQLKIKITHYIVTHHICDRFSTFLFLTTMKASNFHFVLTRIRSEHSVVHVTCGTACSLSGRSFMIFIAFLRSDVIISKEVWLSLKPTKPLSRKIQ